MTDKVSTRQGHESLSPSSRRGNPSGAMWWEFESPHEVAEGIQSTVQTLTRSNKARLEQNLLHSRLYGNYLPLVQSVGAPALHANSAINRTKLKHDRMTFNVCQSCLDTLSSKISKSHPRPMFLTNGGTWVEMKRAKLLNQFADGVFHEAKYDSVAQLVFRDAGAVGTGILHPYRDAGDRIAMERVFSSEILIDEVEALYGSPRQMFRMKLVDKRQLAAAKAFEKYKDIILQADPARMGHDPGISDSVNVIEAWHLPSGDDADDGRHCISIGQHLLFSEKWERQDFPFAFLNFSHRMWGFWGQGLVEQLTSIQIQINKLLYIITRSLELGGSYKWLVEHGSKVNPNHINNEFGAILFYTGTQPVAVAPPIIQPELYQELETLIRRAYEVSGISQLSAASQKPAGLNSGRALRTMTDIESDRFQVIAQAFEQLAVDVAPLCIEVAKEIGPEFSVRVPSHTRFDSLKWKDVQLERDMYIIKCFPVSALPNTPAERMQTVTEMVQAGWIQGPNQGRKLLNFPDLEQDDSLALAQEEYLQSIIERILDDGELTPLTEYDNIQRAREMALQYYSRARMQGVDEERLALLETFIVQVNELQVAAAPPPAPVAAQAPANPTPTPTSELLPNINAAA